MLGESMALTREQILEEVKKSPNQKVKVAVTDIDGILRGKYLHLNKFNSIVEGGFGFCDVVFGWDCGDVGYENVNFTGWHSGFPDALASLDLQTFRKIPWDNDVSFFLADFNDEKGKALDVCPRQLLKKVKKEAEKMGCSASFGQEFEWFNFKETSENLNDRHFVEPHPLSPGMFGYSILRMSQNSDFLNELFDSMAKFRVPIEGLHTETGPGVLEAAILYDDVLESADRAVLFKSFRKSI